MVGYSVEGLRCRAATTQCLLSWNCAGVGVDILVLPTPLGTSSLALVLDEPVELGCERVGFCKKFKQICARPGGMDDPYCPSPAMLSLTYWSSVLAGNVTVWAPHAVCFA